MPSINFFRDISSSTSSATTSARGRTDGGSFPTILETHHPPLVSGQRVKLVKGWYYHLGGIEDGTYEDPHGVSMRGRYMPPYDASVVTVLPTGTILSYRERRSYPPEDCIDDYFKFMFWWPEKRVHLFCAININQTDIRMSRLTTFTLVPS